MYGPNMLNQMIIGPESLTTLITIVIEPHFRVCLISTLSTEVANHVGFQAVSPIDHLATSCAFNRLPIILLHLAVNQTTLVVGFHLFGWIQIFTTWTIDVNVAAMPSLFFHMVY